MRGTPTDAPTWRRVRGIIPAYAGNTAHPRRPGHHDRGSSPRMRGTHAFGNGRLDLPGIIPAYAGNTCRPYRRAQYTWDHPRVCGEHMTGFAQGLNTGGSSPRMRGTQATGVVHDRAFGIIPAYAGNTTPTIVRTLPAWDHPRVCGEHKPDALFAYRCKGSSPRMRGTPIAVL